MNDTDEWYDVESINDHSYRITETDVYGMFLIAGDSEALVVDAGAGVGDLRGLVEELVDVPVSLFLTHSHWDHIGAAAQFDTVYVDERELAPNGGVAIDGLSDEFVFRPGQFTEEWLEEGNEFPDGFDPAEFELPPVTPDTIEVVGHGDRIDLGDRVLDIVEVPGHSPGQLALLDRAAADAYGGDVVHMNTGLYVHFQHCDLEAYATSFERLRVLRDDEAFDRLLTSHNPAFANDELAVLDRLHTGLEGILAGDLDYDLVETPWGEAREYDIEGSPVFTKPTLD